MTIHWNNDLSQSWSAVKDFVHGAVIDNAVELWHFLPDVTQYVLGSDETLGAGRATGWRGLWRTYDDWGSERANPITGPIYRSIDVVNTMVYGSLDLVLAHTPDALFNQQLGWNIPYFHPAPKDARGMGRDVGMAALIFATPAIKAKTYRVLGVEPKPMSVAETKLARDLQRVAAATQRPTAPVLSPAPVFMIALSLLDLIRWVRERVARHADSTAQRDLQTLDEANIATLADAAPNNSEALNALVELARVENETALAALEKLAALGNQAAVLALMHAADAGIDRARVSLLDFDLGILAERATRNLNDFITLLVLAIRYARPDAMAIVALPIGKIVALGESNPAVIRALQTITLDRLIVAARQGNKSAQTILGHLRDAGNPLAIEYFRRPGSGGNGFN